MPERDANQLAADAAENREWIANWRDGMFSSTSRDAEGWPIEMHGVVASLEQALTDVDELVALVGTLQRKADAYDQARAVVKTEGNTRAYYVLRAEAAEAALATTRQALTEIANQSIPLPGGAVVPTSAHIARRALADTGGDTKEPAPTDPGRTHTVVFDFCHHLAFLLDEEYGDGSAWCQVCGEFRVYEDAPGGAVT